MLMVRGALSEGVRVESWRVLSAGAILPRYELHLCFISALHAGGERFLVAGGQHAAPECTLERAVSTGHDQGT